MASIKTLLAIILSCFCLIIANAADERIWVDAKINGKPIRLFLDTGTTGDLAIFSTTAKRLGIKYTPPEKLPNPGHVHIGWTETCSFELQTNEAEMPIAVVEVPDYAKLQEDGILGWAAIKNNVISIDAVSGKFSLGAHVPEDRNKWQKLQLETNLDSLALDLPLDNGLMGIVSFDTGSAFGVQVNSQKWNGWKRTHPNQPSTFESYGTPSMGWVIKEESWADKLSLGTLVLNDVPIMEADQNDVVLSALPQAEFQANLGLTALKRLDIVIDGKNNVAYLRSKTTPPSPYQHNRLGADFAPQNSDNDDLIVHVANDSPAYKAGIRNGDVLLEINGRDETKWRTDTNPPPKVSAIELPAGTKLKLTLKRGDKVFKTTAILKNILPPDAPKNSN
jgi:PDZ domain/Aspartyl protease